MSGRTRKTMIARAWGEDLEYKTAGNYSLAGVIRYTSPGAQEITVRVAAVGNSVKSVASRAKTVLRRVRPGTLPSDYAYLVEVVPLIEATAPCVRKYFGTHRVVIDAIFRPGLDDQDEMMQPGWTTPTRAGMVTAGKNGEVIHAMAAGCPLIRRLAKEGWTGVAFRGAGGRSADFTMDELLKSMNARKKA